MGILLQLPLCSITSTSCLMLTKTLAKIISIMQYSYAGIFAVCFYFYFCPVRRRRQVMPRFTITFAKLDANKSNNTAKHNKNGKPKHKHKQQLLCEYSRITKCSFPTTKHYPGNCIQVSSQKQSHNK